MLGLEVRDIPIKLKRDRELVQAFLSQNGLRMDAMDYYVGVFDENDRLIAGGGCAENVIKCVAVSGESRDLNLAGILVTKLREYVRNLDFENIFVFTKAENECVFKNLSFFTVGKTNKAVMMESNPYTLKKYKKYLNGFVSDGVNGCIVMNCNPFTKGPRYLIEQSAALVDRLHVVMVKEGKTMFPYADRLELVKRGVSGLSNVDVVEGSSYVISEATFPNYFIKNMNEVSEVQVELDLDVFVKHIAPSLNTSIRFMGSELADPLTAMYNRKMKEILPKYGIKTLELNRLSVDGIPVSASRVRKAIQEKDLAQLEKFLPETTLSYVKENGIV